MVLIDRYLPTFDVREYREIRVAAPVERAYAVLRSVDLNRSRLVRALFAIRTLPSRFERQEPRRSVANASFLEEALSLGWVVLEEIPGREFIAGAVTQPWAPVVHFKGLPGPEFIAFSEPGFAKIVWTLAATPEGSDQTVLSTETRVLTTDSVSRRRFRRYWFLVSPGIKAIRHVALRLARDELERSAKAA